MVTNRTFDADLYVPSIFSMILGQFNGFWISWPYQTCFAIDMWKSPVQRYNVGVFPGGLGRRCASSYRRSSSFHACGMVGRGTFEDSRSQLKEAGKTMENPPQVFVKLTNHCMFEFLVWWDFWWDFYDDIFWDCALKLSQSLGFYFGV